MTQYIAFAGVWLVVFLLCFGLVGLLNDSGIGTPDKYWWKSGLLLGAIVATAITALSWGCYWLAIKIF